MTSKSVFNYKPFYDPNIPPEIKGHALKELSEDIWQYQKLITRVEIIGKSGREFIKKLNNKHFEISVQDDGATIKLFEEELPNE